MPEPRACHRLSRCASARRVAPRFADLRILLIVHVGDQEIRLSDSTRLTAVEAELEIWPEVWHVWHLFAPMLPDANHALGKIGEFVGDRLGDRRSSL